MPMRTTRGGRQIDMDAMIVKHGDMKAVGNINVNARGDRLDGAGNVIRTAAEMAAAAHAAPVQRTTRSIADAGFTPEPAAPAPVAEAPQPEAAVIPAEPAKPKRAPAKKAAKAEAPAPANDGFVEDADGNFVPAADA